MAKNKTVVPQASAALDQMKMEIAQELGIHLDPAYNGDLSARDAGRIGGEVTRRLIQIAEQSLQHGRR
jgi:hypothetical protein